MTTMMKSLEEQDHYEILEVARSAPQEEIDRAYKIAHDAYGEGALAHYSIFESADAEQIRVRIEQAYAVLRDPDRRLEYDRTGLAQNEAVPSDETSVDRRLGLGFDLESGRSTVRSTPLAMEAYELPGATAPEIPPAPNAYADLDVEADEEAGNFDGATLRRARMRRGIEIDQVARVTKVSPAYLRFLEEERFEALPAPVYVRGFVSAYARAIGLDPQHVATSYMGVYEEPQAKPLRSRLLGRK